MPFEYLQHTEPPPPPDLLGKLNLTQLEALLEDNVPSYIPAMEWGLCLPKDCSSEDVTGLFIEYNWPANNTLFRSVRTNCLPTDNRWTAGPVVVVTLAALLGLLALVGTIIDYLKNSTELLSSKHAHQETTEYHFAPLEEADDEMHTFVNPGVIETENVRLPL